MTGEEMAEAINAARHSLTVTRHEEEFLGYRRVTGREPEPLYRRWTLTFWVDFTGYGVPS
mgnify:CR=1 FL=1